MLDRIRSVRDQRGFTLIELLIVISILGILAGIVVVSVGGITDRGNQSACSTDRKSLKSISETYRAQNNTYGNEFALKPGFIAEFSTLHDVTVGADTAAATAATNSETSSVTGAAYVVKVTAAGVTATCGTLNQVV